MKICSKCKIEKDEKDFNLEKRNKSGITNSCRSCNYLLDKSRPNYKTKKAESDKRYNKKHRESIKIKQAAYAKVYGQKNKEKINEYNREWSKLNKQARRDIHNKSKRKAINELRPYYIRRLAVHTFGWTHETLKKHPEIITALTEIIKNKRLCKTLRTS